jgi:hypothetical protein
MPPTRINSKVEVFNLLTEVGLIRDATAGTPGSGLLTVAAIPTDVTVTLDTGEGADFATDDLVRIGSDDKLEENVVLSVAVDVLTLKMPLAYAHAIGEAVVERARVKVGEPTEEGITARTETELFEVGIATSRKPYLRQIVGATSEISFSIVNFNLNNIAAAAGVPESSISGAGTAASPWALDLLDTLLGTEQNLSMYGQGLRQDGTTFEVQGWACDMDPAQEINLRIGEGAGVTLFNGQAQGIRWTSPALP